MNSLHVTPPPSKLLFDEINSLNAENFQAWLDKRSHQENVRRIDSFISYQDLLGYSWEKFIEKIPSSQFKKYLETLKKLGYLGRFGATIAPENFTLVFPSSQLSYLWIPKNACTSTKKLLMQFEPNSINKKIFDNRFHETVQDQYGASLKHVTESPILPCLALTREPTIRLISCYVDKFALPAADSTPFEGFIKNHIANYLKINNIERDINQSISLLEFLDYIESTPGYLHDAHWLPQVAFIPGDWTSLTLIPTSRLDLIPKLLKLQSEKTKIPKSNVRGNSKASLSDYANNDQNEIHSHKLPKCLSKEILTSYNALADTIVKTKIKKLYRDDFKLHALSLVNAQTLDKNHDSSI